MDENKEVKKKESIDEILSDLNGLLNKMPAILEGIKLPDIKPVDFSAALRETPAPVPERETPPAAEDAFDKTVKLDESPLPPAMVPGEKEQMVLQSLGEYMFSADAPVPEPEKVVRRTPLQPEPMSFHMEPAGLDSAPALPEIKPEVQARTENPAVEINQVYGGGSQAAEEADIEKFFVGGTENMEEEKTVNPLDNTKDFGVPDIDAMMRLYQEEAVPPAKDAAVPPENASAGQAGPGPDAGASAEIAPQTESAREPDPVRETVSDPAHGAGSESDTDPELGLENIIIKPASGIVEEKGGVMDLNEENPGENTLSEQPKPVDPEQQIPEAAAPGVEPQSEISSPQEFTLEIKEQTPEPGLVIDNANSAFNTELPAAVIPDEEDKTLIVASPSSGPQDALENTLSEQPKPVDPEQQIPEAAAPAVEPQPESSSPGEFTLKIQEPAPEPGLALDRTDSSLEINAPAASAGDEDKTMVIAPPSSGSDDEKTVIYEAGANPGVTSRHREDLGSLIAKSAPESIPPERVRTVGFLYAQEDAALCSDMLSELDSICLRSPSKPMFIKRAFVHICEPGTNGNVVMQKVADFKAVGLVVLGNVPQESIYEIENVFTAGGVFFRHLPREGFSHSAVLDLVTEFILK
ncbi:MAG: hypothetical protein A2270_11615 [Elusimicrobia bacterium RIFOXYA12_FULL_51_18]|nr:MAG: hypothetical protein A2270_11615 [Elusimicrobia bacterium RIFOXYA12_FULL_51_18]OGS28814.1 MAG: hypothetical protein A2218_09075 [Elusimicrobia bacterium RIFOXYA2_FULL_53_38]